MRPFQAVRQHQLLIVEQVGRGTIGDYRAAVQHNGPRAQLDDQLQVVRRDQLGGGNLPEQRLEYPGAMYHVMNRGDQREDILRDDQDRQKFLSTLGEACAKTEWQVHAYCLMRNHFHLVLETPQPNVVFGMKWLLGVYTKRFNIRHKLCGHLFAGRYKALVVEGSGNGYLRTVCDYVHLNPVRAKLLPP